MGRVMRAAGANVASMSLGMFYSPDKSFATVYSLERAESLSTLFGSTDVHAWIDRLAPPGIDMPLRVEGDNHVTPYDSVWLPPDIDPLTGDSVVRVVQLAFDGRDVFAVFVWGVPESLLHDTLNAYRLVGALLMVIDRLGHVVAALRRSRAERNPPDANRPIVRFNASISNTRKERSSTGRNTFHSNTTSSTHSTAARRTPNAARRTPNAERRTPNANR
ncbi:hypothetical protein WJ47_21765 [Burkholderia ubonensis]|uniref:Uncharacterized protein n=1 Tax=Burkholderia ubonensis TaxID=101571 RepID=A0AB73FVJ9_9BURK|nr:hypothetical protein [Burkholderia ubonensis]KVK83894.1 hypothetical protein WJ44_06565 [Burkholderia ubonensis]KVL82933.1 hypothetical protein WJ47_21765 [Burkholderia ubonensis]KVM23930.1 hypothetical protein WJ53_17605 [Burkholderia ubonensis]